MQSLLRGNTYHDVTTFKVDWMLEDIASGISKKW